MSMLLSGGGTRAPEGSPGCSGNPGLPWPVGQGGFLVKGM